MVRIPGQRAAPLVDPGSSIPQGIGGGAGAVPLATGRAAAQVGDAIANVALEIEDQNATTTAISTMSDIKQFGRSTLLDARDNSFLSKSSQKLHSRDIDAPVDSDGQVFDEFVMDKFDSFVEKSLSGASPLVRSKLEAKLSNFKDRMSNDILATMSTGQRRARLEVFDREAKEAERAIQEDPENFVSEMNKLVELDVANKTNLNIQEPGSKLGATLAFRAAKQTIINNPEEGMRLLEGGKGDFEGFDGEVAEQEAPWRAHLSAAQVDQLRAVGDRHQRKAVKEVQERAISAIQNDFASIQSTGIGAWRNNEDFRESLVEAKFDKGFIERQVRFRELALRTFVDKESIKSMPLLGQNAFLASRRPLPGDPEFKLKAEIFNDLVRFKKDQDRMRQNDMAMWAEQVDPESFTSGMTIVQRINERRRILEAAGVQDKDMKLLTKADVSSLNELLHSGSEDDLLGVIQKIKEFHDEIDPTAPNEALLKTKHGSAILKELAADKNQSPFFRIAILAADDGRAHSVRDIQNVIKNAEAIEKFKPFEGLDDEINTAIDAEDSTFSRWSQAIVSGRADNIFNSNTMREMVQKTAKMYMITQKGLNAEEATKKAMKTLIGDSINEISSSPEFEQMVLPKQIVSSGEIIQVDREVVEDRLETLRLALKPKQTPLTTEQVERLKGLEKKGLTKRDLTLMLSSGLEGFAFNQLLKKLQDSKDVRALDKGIRKFFRENDFLLAAPMGVGFGLFNAFQDKQIDPDDLIFTSKANEFDLVKTVGRDNFERLRQVDIDRALKNGVWRTTGDGEHIQFIISFSNFGTKGALLNSEGKPLTFSVRELTKSKFNTDLQNNPQLRSDQNEFTETRPEAPTPPPEPQQNQPAP